MTSKASEKFVTDKIFSESYNEGIKRIIGLTDDEPFEFPKKILERRQKFWDKFCHKYSQEIINETELNLHTLKRYRKKPEHESSNAVQYWVNTGHLPYEKERQHTNENEQLDSTNLSHHHIVEMKSNSQHVQPNCNDNSSYSSVDTTAYILSNMNTTNKVETVAIVEGAKYNAVVSSQNTQNIEKAQAVPDKTCGKNNENIMDNSCKFLISDNSQNRNSTIKQNLSNMTPHLVTKVEHRKKLYTGRDSPVDLINMKSNNNKSTMPEFKQNVHPALDLGRKLSKRCKIYERRRTMHFSMFNKNLTNNSQFSVPIYSKRKRRKSNRNFNESPITMTDLTKNDTLSVNNSIIKNSMVDQHLIVPINECTNTKNKFNKPTNHLKTSRTKKYKESSNMTRKSTNLNPVVCLTRLSKDDIEKYTRSKKVMKNLNSLSAVQLSKLRNKERKEQKKPMANLENLNSTSRLTCLSVLGIQKHKKLNNTGLDLNPVVRLKRLSEFEIKKYKNTANVVTNLANLNSASFKAPTKLDIQKYKSVSDKRTLNKDDLVSEIIQLQNDDASLCQSSQFGTSSYTNPLLNISNVTSESTSSDDTLLIYKCDSISLDNCSISNLSVLSNNYSAPYSKYINVDEMINDNEREQELNNEVNKEVKIIDIRAKHKVKRISDNCKLKLNANKSNLKYNNKCDAKNNKFEKICNINNSLKTNLTNLNVNKGLFLKKDVHRHKNNSNCGDNSVHTNNKKKESLNLYLSDEGEEFVKLIHCPKETQKSKLKLRYETLNKNFNSPVEKLDNVRFDTTHDSVKCPQKITKDVIKCTNNQFISESIIKDSKSETEKHVSPIKNKIMKQSSQQCNLLVKGNCNQELRKSKSNNKSNNKSNSNRLCFKTKGFLSDSDSDSESLMVLNGSSNKLLLCDEE